jgi:hypothetical protein
VFQALAKMGNHDTLVSLEQEETRMTVQEHPYVFLPDVIVEEVVAPDAPFRFKWLGVDVAYDAKANTVTAPLSAADPALQSWLRTIFGDEVTG